MLSSPSLEVAIGLVFCFASVALIASSATEAIASLFALRSKTLLAGVKELLNDPNLEDLARDVYNNALVHPRGDGTIPKNAAAASIKSAPAYIEPMAFAVALVEALQKVPGGWVQLEASIAAIQSEQLRRLLQGMLARAEGDIDSFERQVAAWFDNGMDHVSGLYKRYVQVVTFVVALMAAALMNVDSIHLAQALWKQPSQAAQIDALKFVDGHPAKPSDATSPEPVQDVIVSMQQLPIGRLYPDIDHWHALAWDLFGVLLTASAAMFGAPFWFDLLQSLIRIRSSGPTPDEKAKQRAQEA